MDGHQEPFVVVLALLDELLTEPVLLNPDVLDADGHAAGAGEGAVGASARHAGTLPGASTPIL
jgi:hypothetical protein